MNTSLNLKEMADKAKSIYMSGDYPAAAAAFADAGAAYTAAGDALGAAEMQNNRSVALLRAGDPKAALEAVQGTEKVFADGGDFRRQGMALANEGSALQALKRNQEAVEKFTRSAEVLDKAGEGDLRLEVMQLLSSQYLRRFKFFEAILALQSGLSGVKNPTPRQKLMKKILFIRL